MVCFKPTITIKFSKFSKFNKLIQSKNNLNLVYIEASNFNNKEQPKFF